MHKKNSKFGLSLLAGLIAVAFANPSAAADLALHRPLPETLAHAKLKRSAHATLSVSEAARAHAGVMATSGQVTVLVRLNEAPVARSLTARAAANAMQRVQRSQENFLSRMHSSDMKVVGRTHAAANALLLEVDASAVKAIANDPAVARVTRVHDYPLDLSDTVPYIGATIVQQAGITGRGVKVAVLDSGIDYLHAEFGGSGDPQDFVDNDPSTIEPGSFPTARVVGGTDFVGAVWPAGPLQPDPDPLDAGDGRGHGTHVADIIGGARGVAPEVDLYALKVCSSVTTSCSGVALLRGIDFAVDPNGDGDTSDHLDIINMSLGSDYGTAFDDELSFFVDQATAAGVLTVASAGNGADKPYVAGTPANAPTALSVAQTEVPSERLNFMRILSPASAAGSFGAVYQPWSGALPSSIDGGVQYADGAGGNRTGCAPFAPGSLAGKIVLVDRGACDFSLKTSNIGDAGGLVAVIGLIDGSDPFAGGLGAGNPQIPAFMVNLATANRLRAPLAQGVAVAVRFDPDAQISLAGHMRFSSSRGPSMGTNAIKPEIGAPGASVSAIAGSGDQSEAFGGTSGAAPMVTGSAALLKQAYPTRSPLELKALLMNTAATDVLNRPATFGGQLAPIARIGAGEVRVNRAHSTAAAAWEEDHRGPLNFGFSDVDQLKSDNRRWVTVRNYSDQAITYQITTEFRFNNDAARGAVSLLTPKSITVPAHSDARFQVHLLVAGNRLERWTMNSGSNGSSAALMTRLEYDGYVRLSDSSNQQNNIHLPWLIVPRQAGDIRAQRFVDANEVTRVRNDGVGASDIEAYSLIGISGNLPQGNAGEDNPAPDLRYVGYATFPVDAGFCSDNPSFVLAFAANTWERQTHLVAPFSLEFDLDIDRDGVADYAVFSFDESLSTRLSGGRNLAWALKLTTGDVSAFFFSEHDTNTGNSVLQVCAEQIGLNISSAFKPIDVAVLAVDFYNTGTVTDALDGITIAPLGEQFIALFNNTQIGFTTIPPGGKAPLRIVDFGRSENNTETGVLLLYRPGAPPNNEAAAITVEASEE